MSNKNKADFSIPVEVDIVIPIYNDGKFKDTKCKMTIILCRVSELETALEIDKASEINKFLIDKVVSPPNICDENGDNYTIEDLLDIAYIRSKIMERLLEVSSDPLAAKGN